MWPCRARLDQIQEQRGHHRERHRADATGDHRRRRVASAGVAPAVGRRRGGTGRSVRPSRLRRGHAGPLRSPRRDRRPPGRRRGSRGRHALHHARTLLPPGPHGSVHGRDHRGRRGPGGRRPRRSRPEGRRSRHRSSCGAAGIEVEVGVAADEVERQLAPYLVHRRTGRPYVRAQAGGHARRPHRRTRRHLAVDHRTRGPRSTPTGCGPTATWSWSAPGPSGPTTRRSPCGCPTASWPTGSSSRPVSCSVGRPRRPAPDRWSSRAAPRPRCSTSWASAARCRC